MSYQNFIMSEHLWVVLTFYLGIKISFHFGGVANDNCDIDNSVRMNMKHLNMAKHH